MSIQSKTGSTRRLRAILLDDDDMVRQVVTDLFGRRGYDVIALPHPLGFCARTPELLTYPFR